MIKIKTIFVVFLFAVCTICVDVHIGRSAEPDIASSPEGGAELKALVWGFKFASAIPAKPHIADRSKSQYSVLSCCLEKNLPDKVVELTESLDGWRRCLLYADLAYYFAERDSIENLRMYLERGEACRNSLDGWNAGWQKDRILLREAEAQVLSKQWAAAEKTEAGLPSEFVARSSALRFSRLDGAGAYENRLGQLQPLEKSEYMEVRRDVARAYIEILKQLGDEATDAQYVQLKNRIYSLAQKLPRLIQHEILCSLSRTVFDTGNREMGKEVLEDIEEGLKKWKLNPRYDVAALVDLSQIRHEAGGETERSESLLLKAEDLLKASDLTPMAKIPALISVASGYGSLGNEGAAWDYFRNALQTAGAMVNARPRAMAVTGICIGIAKWGAPLTDDIEEKLTRLYEALGDPW